MRDFSTCRRAGSVGILSIAIGLPTVCFVMAWLGFVRPWMAEQLNHGPHSWWVFTLIDLFAFLVIAYVTTAFVRRLMGSTITRVQTVEVPSSLAAVDPSLQRIRQEYRDMERTYLSLLENIPDGVLTFAADGQLLNANPAVRAITGYTSTELLERPLLHFFPRDQRTLILREFVHARKGSTRAFETTLFHRAGHRIRVRIRTIPVQIKDHVAGFMSTVQDVTQIHHNHEVLRATKELLESFVNHTADAIHVVDLDGRVLLVNDAFERMYGWKSENIVGRTIPMVPPEFCQEYEEMLQMILAGGQVSDRETVRLHHNGNRMYVSSTVSPIRDACGEIRAIASIGRDITERKRTEELLQRSDKLAAIGQLAAGLAHEIRNPMTSLKGFLQLMEEKMTGFPEYFGIMNAEIDRIEVIVTEFLRLARPITEEKHLASVEEMLGHVVALLNTQAILYNISLRLDIARPLPHLLCSENQLKQVFVNLIKNAIEAMPSGGKIVISAWVEEAQRTVIRVQDSGPGIPASILHRIGQPFFTTKESGTGLGMMISQKIVAAHGGEISVQSREGEGTIIDVSLPVAPPQPTRE